jgi:Ca2+-transporting ATPase
VIVETLEDVYQIEDGQFLSEMGTIDRRANPELQHLLEIITLCNEANQENGNGSSTEIALLELAMANDIDIEELRSSYRCLEIRERAEDRPLMSTIHEDGNKLLVAVKGRPYEILERCSEKMVAGHVKPLTDADRQAVLDANERMAGQALRVLGVAHRQIGKRAKRDARKLVWLGLVGMQDPLRPGMPELMQQFHQAGIKTVMITGDQSATAYAIGKQLGLANDKSLEILDSTQLDKMEPKLLAGLVRRVDVFSRVSPAHKLRIVQALQEAGTVVAMTGDGINDGPALKAADIGVAMGASGTDIARSVADVVIEDDNLHTMAVAVRQGRTIYANIRKTIHYLLSTNFSEIKVMLVGITAGLGTPLNPRQLLWINLVTDIFPGLALSFEPASHDVMQQQPRSPDASMLTKQRLGIMAVESSFITAGAMAAFLFGRARGGHAMGSTLAFHTLTMAQLLHAIASRSKHHSIYDTPRLPQNKWLDRALIGTAAGQLATMMLPPLRNLMGNTMIGPVDLLVIASGAGLPLVINEAFKKVRQLPGKHLHKKKQQLEGHTHGD